MMHDPTVMVFNIPRIRLDVWHDEPNGHDSGTVCKGMGSTELSWHNVRWAWKHRDHLHYRFWPYLTVKRWLFDHCDLCGKRFLWKQARFSYMSTDKVWHEYCQGYKQAKSQRDEAWQFIADPGSMDNTARWRVGYAVDNYLGLRGGDDEVPA